MLVNSRQILTEINNTAHLKEALALVVQRSRSSFDAYTMMLESDRLNAGAQLHGSIMGNGRAAR